MGCENPWSGPHYLPSPLAFDGHAAFKGKAKFGKEINGCVKTPLSTRLLFCGPGVPRR
jgi:hypothetical protein